MIPEEEKLILENDPVLPRMFGLPKLHKQGHPMRPVVSCVKSALAKSGNLIDNTIKPSVEAGWQFLQDSTATLRYIQKREQELLKEGFTHDQMFLVSFDVASFYPSVPHETAMEAFGRACDNLEISPEQFESIEKILDFHLKNAFFSYNGNFYRQKTGLPIGSSIGGPVACLALALEEDKLLERLRVENPRRARIFEAYRRYLDDSILMFGAKDFDDAKFLADSLHSQLVSMRQGFDFTFTGATKSLVVLDIEITITSTEVITKNYQKPTDKRTLLNSESCHPKHVKSAIAYGVGLRMRRLCSREEDFMQALRDQAWALKGRGYEDSWIRKGFAKAILKSREQALQKSTRADTKNTVRLITTFDQNLNVPKAFKKLKKEKSSLENTQNGTHLKSFEIQSVSRNALNLRRRLVNKPSKPKSTTSEKYQGFTNCEKCVLCRDLKNEKTVTTFPRVFQLEEEFTRNFKMPTATCQSKNVVYFAGCLQCGKFYIGETSQSVEKRCQRHRLLKNDVQDLATSGLGESWSEVRAHFATENHVNALWITVLDVLQDGTTKRLREQKEMKRIRELKPILNIKKNPVSRFSNSPAVLPRTRTRRRAPSLKTTPDASQPSPSQPATPGRADDSPADGQPARISRPKKTPSSTISASQTATPVQAGDNTQPAR